MYATMDTPESRYETNKGVSILRVSVIFMYMSVRINHAALQTLEKSHRFVEIVHVHFAKRYSVFYQNDARSQMQSGIKYAGES